MQISKDFKIITERMILVPISLEYKNIIFKEFTEEVARYLMPQPTDNINDTINFINDSSEKTLKGEELQLVALDKNSEEFLGLVGLHRTNTKIPELGLWFKRAAWGIGYGKESMFAIKKWAEANLDYENISYPVYKENIASRKIAEFLGGKIVKESISKNQRGIEHDEIEYWISRQ